MTTLRKRWVLHPRLGVVAQHITPDERTNSKGATVSEAEIDCHRADRDAKLQA
ncbi:hypothetical protein [Paracoccus ravus]|uniref:hypothetical protein n=1 Tax=Paracoccus ravus TaxID=2447760 RepID=UPI00142FD643|nr:hypothetical protein [Paracoccus ravus]